MAKFKPGQSGNPAGRPKGVRNKFAENFVSALLADFEEHGIAAIVKVREKSPAQYLRVCAALVPKDFSITSDVRPLSDYSAAELLALRERLSPTIDDSGSSSKVH